MFASSTPHPAHPEAVTPSRIRRRKPGDPKGWNLTLTAAGTAVPVKTVAASPTLVMVAVEDLCWRLAADDAQARKPRWWQRAQRSAWRADLARLEDKRARIAEMAFAEINAL